ncbi:hypothetical protein TrispH2_004051 [Trichoplax sp. H2]|nr:hypothetical protein TrispH2_004051 [Trichoplax sp. H2]|eukprot:RDD43018.1 hypothetical protein TrispH2_004051 [Trichoplax sp. H2]
MVGKHSYATDLSREVSLFKCQVENPLPIVLTEESPCNKTVYQALTKKFRRNAENTPCSPIENSPVSDDGKYVDEVIEGDKISYDLLSSEVHINLKAFTEIF